MADTQAFESDLLSEIRSRLQRLAEAQRRLVRDHGILTRSATHLRLGKSAEAVMAEIREQNPELLGDHCELQLTRLGSPPRSVGPRA